MAPFLLTATMPMIAMLFSPVPFPVDFHIPERSALFCQLIQDKVIQGAQNINEIFGVRQFHSRPFTLYLASYE